jgi:chromosome segregation ATPase
MKMFDSINRQLEEAQEGILRKQKIQAMVNELENERSLLRSKESELKAALDKEDVDVEKLEGKSLAHIFHIVLGNLDEHLEKERREALTARLKYDLAIRDLENVNLQIEKLVSEMQQYNACQHEFEQLYEKKKEMLMQTNNVAADKIMELSVRLTKLDHHRKEIREAMDAGSAVIENLNSTLESLNSAEGWGTWDLLGGGLLSDLAKHSHIDDAKADAERAQEALLHFRTELTDVRIDNNIHFETDGFAKFADFFFDGLIADWSMQSRIHDSQDSVENVRNQVQSVVYKLNSMDQADQQQAEQIKKEIKNLITNA